MALPISTTIITSNGWTTVGQLKSGDSVFSHEGCPIAIEGVGQIQSNTPCFQITFSDNCSIIVDHKQQFFTWPYKVRWAMSDSSRTTNHRARKVNAETIRDTLIYGSRKPDHGIEIGAALQYPEQELPIHPYVLGAWLGDGDSTGARFSSADLEVIEFIREAGYPARKSSGKDPYLWLLTDGVRLGVDSKVKDCLNSRLRKNGLLNNKHIPQKYLYGSIEQRTLLLQGLMDTDGSCKAGGHCIFVNTNLRLTQAVQELVTGLGAKATLIAEKSNLHVTDRNWKQPYAVRFTPTFPVFRLKRKLARQRLENIPLNRRFRYVADVQPVPPVPVREIYLAGQPSLFQVCKECIPVLSEAYVEV